MVKKIANIICPHCDAKVIALRGIKGRVIVTTSVGLSLGIAGGVLGAVLGVASGGWGISGTVPLATIGAIVGSGTGYIISDKLVDKPKCPKCGKIINLGFNV